MNISDNEVLLIYNSNNLQDREALAYAKTLKNHKLKELDIQNDMLSPSQIKEISQYMGKDVQDLVDMNSTIYHKEFKDAKIDEEGFLKALRKNPGLLKTPIFISKTRAKFLDSAFEFISQDMSHGNNPAEDDYDSRQKLE